MGGGIARNWMGAVLAACLFAPVSMVAAATNTDNGQEFYQQQPVRVITASLADTWELRENQVQALISSPEAAQATGEAVAGGKQALSSETTQAFSYMMTGAYGTPFGPIRIIPTAAPMMASEPVGSAPRSRAALTGPYSSREILSNLTMAYGTTDLNSPWLAIDMHRDAGEQVHKNITALAGSILASMVGKAGAETVGSLDAQALDAIDGKLANRIWVAGFGSWREQKERNGRSGYEFKTRGGGIGYDRMFGQMLVGVSGAYGKGNVDYDYIMDGDTDIRAYSLNLYAKYFHASGFENTVHGGYTRADHEYDQHMSMVGLRKRADMKTTVWSVGDTIGYSRTVGKLTLTPSVGLVYTRAKTGSYTTRNGYNVRMKIDSVESVVMPATMEFGYLTRLSSCSTLSLTAHGGFRHDFSDDAATGMLYIDPALPGIPVVGMEPANNIWTVGGGMKYANGRVDVFAKYDYDFKAQYRGHNFVGGVSVKF